MTPVFLTNDLVRMPKKSRVDCCGQAINQTPYFCITDSVAIGTLRALATFHARAPDDIADIGFDGIQEGKYLGPPSQQ